MRPTRTNSEIWTMAALGAVLDELPHEHVARFHAAARTHADAVTARADTAPGVVLDAYASVLSVADRSMASRMRTDALPELEVAEQAEHHVPVNDPRALHAFRVA